MKAWETVAKEKGPDGTLLELARRDGEYVIRAGGRDLMTSRQHASEDALATLGCADVGSSPHVLVGGLGMGYTLRAALDRLPSTASVVVAEISSAVIAWARGPLRELAGDPCADARAHVERADVAVLIAKAPKSRRFDAILLDVDNGPEAIVARRNALLYTEKGLTNAMNALAPRGVLAIWSASDAPDLERAMANVGLAVVVHRVGNASRGNASRTNAGTNVDRQEGTEAKTSRGRRHVVIIGKKSS